MGLSPSNAFSNTLVTAMFKWLVPISGLILLVAMGVLHWVVPARIERSMNITRDHVRYEISPAAQALHNDMFIADLHADTLLWKRNLLERSAVGHVDLPRLQAGNVGLQVFAAVTKSPSGENYTANSDASDNITWLALAQLWPLQTWFSLYQRAAFQLDKLTDFAAASDDHLRLIRNRADLQQLLLDRLAGRKVTGGLFAIEGGHALEGDIDNLDRLQQAGLRVIGLTHFFDNELGGSLHGTSGAGLTEFGRQVVQRADELELIIDLAHVSPQLVRDVLAFGHRPALLSHEGIKGLCDMGRNLDDDLMLELAAKGGILGIGYWDGAVCDPTPLGIVKAIRRAIELLGENHVALGSDYDGTTEVLMDTSELAILTSVMLEQGFDEREIRKVMGENVKRFLLENLPGA